MAKFKPGIPDGFNLNVEPVRDLGDYLDEPRPAPAPQRKATEAPPPEVTPAPARAAPEPPPVQSAAEVTEAPAPQPPQASRQAASPPPAAPPGGPAPWAAPAAAAAQNHDEGEGRGLKAKAPRREISMTPEALRMSDELLEVVRSGSGQRDTKANELFYALVLLVYEAIDDIDIHSIPLRGRWGSPTARSYPLELKNAFLKALLKKHGGVGNVIHLQYPANDAA